MCYVSPSTYFIGKVDHQFQDTCEFSPVRVAVKRFLPISSTAQESMNISDHYSIIVSDIMQEVFYA